jgi:hypothetical protein
VVNTVPVVCQGNLSKNTLTSGTKETHHHWNQIQKLQYHLLHSWWRTKSWINSSNFATTNSLDSTGQCLYSRSVYDCSRARNIYSPKHQEELW